MADYKLNKTGAQIDSLLDKIDALADIQSIGNGLTLTGNEIEIDTDIVATKEDIPEGVPTITIDASQVISEDPIQVQLTDEQYNILSSNAFVIIDGSSISYSTGSWIKDAVASVGTLSYSTIIYDRDYNYRHYIIIDEDTKICNLYVQEMLGGIVFNTPYDYSTNKAATMADIATAIGNAMEASY